MNEQKNSPPIASREPTPVWTIVGKGAIGLLAASHAVLNGYPFVQLSLRQQHHRPSFAYYYCKEQQDFPILLSTLQADTNIEFLLLPVKAYDCINAFESHAKQLSPNAQIVICHNGLGTIEHILPKLLPTQGLWFASTTHGAYKSSPLRVVHSGLGQTLIGPLNDAARQVFITEPNDNTVAKGIGAMLGPCQVVSDIMPFLWQKLAVNVVINSLTAIHQVNNGELAKPEYQERIKAIVREFVAVAAEAGYAFVFAEILSVVQQVIAKTSANYSSMLQDIRLQRRTEIDYISGFLLGQAQQAGLSTPYLADLQQELVQSVRSS